VRRVRIVGVAGTAVTLGSLHDLPDSPIQGVQFRGCVIRARRGLLLENVHGIRLRGLRVRQGPAVMRGANVQE
jgi:hypothetical protein